MSQLSHFAPLLRQLAFREHRIVVPGLRRIQVLLGNESGPGQATGRAFARTYLPILKYSMGDDLAVVRARVATIQAECITLG